MRVSVPASTANLGPGFDCLAIALEERFHLDVGEAHADRSRPVEATHPAAVGFRRSGGQGELFMESSIAPGKGMGYSGAALVAGLAAGYLSRFGWVDHPAVGRMAAELEGHPDNVSASLMGGITVAARERIVRLAPPKNLSIVMWIPDEENATATSRRSLPDQVPFRDAVDNIGGASLMVAAFAAGDLAAIRDASADRLHQANRLANQPASAEALNAALALDDTIGAWLSGSGPSVAVLVDGSSADLVAASLPSNAHTKTLSIAVAGVEVHAGA